METAFEQLIRFLGDAGIAPDRVGQVETEDGCTYTDDAPIFYIDGGQGIITINVNGEIFAYGEQVAKMETRDDAWFQAQDMVACL